MVQFFILNSCESYNEEIATKYNLYDEVVRVRSYEQIDNMHDLIVVDSNVWLSKNCLKTLQEVAENNPEIGTLSPLLGFDFKTLECEALKKHILHKNENWDTIVKTCSVAACPEVPRNTLECVYIKKEVLQELGFLQEEEILQSQRVALWFEEIRQLGWKNKLCGQCVAIGDVIYGYDKEFYLDRLTNVVKEMINRFEQTVKLYDELHLSNGRHNILHYLLADFQEGMQNNVGGTQFHVADLVAYQRHSYNVYVLARDGVYLRLTEYTDDEKKQFDFYVGEVPDYKVYYDPIHEKIYELILRAFAIELVHVHHTMWMPLNIYNVADNMNIPIIMSIHDYYYVCPQLIMLSPKGELCSKDSCKLDCQECLKNKKIIKPDRYVEKWRLMHKEALNKCRRIIFPSQYAKKVVTDFYPTIEEQSQVIEHGINLPTKKGNGIQKQHSKLRIAFIGGISDIKGGKLIDQVIRQDNYHYEWYIMGGITNEALTNLKKENLTKTGWYKKNEVYQMLIDNEIDIVCIWSIVAETFCYTLSEALAVGIPVIATRVGALGDRVEKMNCGWLIDRNANARDVLKLLSDLDINRENIAEKRALISNILLKNITMMGKEYDEVYLEYINNSIKISPNVKDVMNYEHNDKMSSCEGMLSDNDTDMTSISIEDNMRYIAEEKELNELKSSLLIKIALRLRKVKIPGKQKIKNFIIKIRK